MTSFRNVTVWLNHQEAHIYHVDADGFDEKTLRVGAGHVRRHPKHGHHGHDPSGGEHRYFHAIAHELAGVNRVLVVGPSTAKLRFLRYAYKHDSLVDARVIGVETVEQASDEQLVAYTRRYFSASSGAFDVVYRGAHF